MYVVTVEFLIASAHSQAFETRVRQQAADSLDREPGCRVFDVCIDPERTGRYFLYEVYDSAEAFRQHLESAHFKAFDAEVVAWVESKSVEVFSRLAVDGGP